LLDLRIDLSPEEDDEGGCIEPRKKEHHRAQCTITLVARQELAPVVSPPLAHPRVIPEKRSGEVFGALRPFDKPPAPAQARAPLPLPLDCRPSAGRNRCAYCRSPSACHLPDWRTCSFRRPTFPKVARLTTPQANLD
jgi:hypothetical protein